MKYEKKKLTTNQGAPVPDNQNVLTAGPRGAWQVYAGTLAN
jgi:catalase